MLVQQFDSDLLAPIVCGRALELYPAIILIVITAGGSLFGFVGVQLAVPTTAIILNRIAELREPDEESGDMEGSGTEPGSTGDETDDDVAVVAGP